MFGRRGYGQNPLVQVISSIITVIVVLLLLFLFYRIIIIGDAQFADRVVRVFENSANWGMDIAKRMGNFIIKYVNKGSVVEIDG